MVAGLGGDGGESLALVLGGGGLGGMAWMAGLLRGLAESGPDLTSADLFVGTSAGSSVAALIAGGVGLDELYRRQIDPQLQSQEIDPEVDLRAFSEQLSATIDGMVPGQQLRRAVGAFALARSTVSESSRRAVIESRLRGVDWSDVRLKIITVDAETGESEVFDRESGVVLADAVAASSAVPGVWPAVTVGSRRYIDGGTRSNDNADLAAGYARVVVLSPLGEHDLIPTELTLERTVGDLRSGGSSVAVICPDTYSQNAFGSNPLDPSTRSPSAAAGLAQGRVTKLDHR